MEPFPAPQVSQSDPSMEKIMAQLNVVDDTRKIFDKQLSELRGEITQLRKALSAQGGDAVSQLKDQADSAYENASARAKSAARYVQDQASVVAGTVKENPATTTTILGVIGVVGFLIGYSIATSSQETKRRWY